MGVAFATKLRMAALALGCSSRKELCARFRAVNRATQCDVDRLNKWVQGRSLPRSASVYADLALAIGSGQSGHWVAACSVEAFVVELVACTGADAAMLTRSDGLAPRGAERAKAFGGIATLAGAFAAYSPAWSPHFRGRLIRGALRLTVGRNGTLVATYVETLVGRTVRLTADVQFGGRSMHFAVCEANGEMPLFISVQVPGPPASVLCGVMSGATFVAHEPLPSACRILFVRVPDTPELEAGNRYLEPASGAIAADLRGLGVNIAEAAPMETLARGFLGSGPEQVTAEDQSRFASLLDPPHLEAAGAGLAVDLRGRRG
jgi:hypothetical protein